MAVRRRAQESVVGVHALRSPRFCQPVERPGHAGSDAEDVASRPWGERAPVIQASDARGDQAVEQVLLAEFRRLLLADRLVLQGSHDDALDASWRDPDISQPAGQ